MLYFTLGDTKLLTFFLYIITVFNTQNIEIKILSLEIWRLKSYAY